jgi:proline iminopeptidase
MPLGIFRSVAGSNEKIHDVLMGPSNFYHTGLLKNWDITPSLSQIDCPTLILSGFYDTATLDQMVELTKRIAGSEQIILKNSSHLGMWEEPVDFWKAVLGFINRH